MESRSDPWVREKLEKLCIMNQGELVRFIYSMTRNDLFAAEEIYQNTMLRALEGLKFLRDSRKMKPWILTVAKAEARRYYAVRSEEAFRPAAARKAENIPSADFTKSIEDAECFLSLISGLSSEEKKLCVLRYYYDIPLKKISVILDENYSTIRSMHRRGILKMRSRLSAKTLKTPGTAAEQDV